MADVDVLSHSYLPQLGEHPLLGGDNIDELGVDNARSIWIVGQLSRSQYHLFIRQN